MPSLSRDLRRLLEKTIAGVNGARQIAEDGAERSLQRLAVDKHEPHTSLTVEERSLRNQLRAHGRQLGDKRDPQRGNQAINHLKQAVAYEHWHRMLFARFLAENDLLLHPEHGVSLSLEEVKEVALGRKRDWIEIAADFAQRMLLSAVFRPDDPVLKVPLPPEKRLELEGKLNSLPREVFMADDSLGWVYQFWQRDAKDEVNRSEVRIGADELAPVTQLFTEDYMVLFLLENTLGAWWAARKGSSELPGYEWTYLRLNEDGTPVAGSFDSWPKAAQELRVFDPCMGSGHFLTFALPILARMRSIEEGTSLRDAIRAVLRENLFGLELDPRCSEIAAFNLALTAWKMAGEHFELPALNLACSGLGINAQEEDWVKLAGADSRVKETMRTLFNIFSGAPILGSLIDPERVGANLFVAEFGEVRALLERALEAEQPSDDARELAIAAHGLMSSAKLLAKFTLVVTNVPYLGRGRQIDALKEHCERFYRDAKADLATCMVTRALGACEHGGTIALVMKDEPLYLSDFRDFRPPLLRDFSWKFVVRLGPRAFETITGEVVKAALIGISKVKPGEGDEFAGVDATPFKTPIEKAEAIKRKDVLWTSQRTQLGNPDSIIVLGGSLGTSFLSQSANAWQGIATSDLPRFERGFWELADVGQGWHFQQSVPNGTKEFAGREHILYWQDGAGAVTEVCQKGATFRGQSAWGRSGVVIGQMSSLPATIYTGEKFSNTVAVIVAYDPSDVPAIWAFCSSPEFARLLRKVNPKLNVDNGYISKVPFDKASWKAVALKQYPNGLPKPHSSDPTQWIFDGNPRGSENPLQVAVARLAGYRWPRQAEVSFPDCPSVCADGLESHAASDGIISFASVAGEEPAPARLRHLLQAALGTEYNLSNLLAGKKSKTPEDWLRDEFFEEHCRLFDEAPFLWHVWDGLKDGFHALVNYHRLDRKTLEKLIYSYVGDWLTRQRQDLSNGVEGADTRLAAADHLQSELKKILEGNPPYDIFVRWKPLRGQPIGWDPDLNDGVRVNIRPWITAACLYRSSKPGILRVTPNIRYAKGRGKEPVRDAKEYPWYKHSTDRINDHHLTLEEKKRARGTQ
jgi:hypothetical protein